MTNQKGTRWETKVVDYLCHLFAVSHIERRARNGAKDRGDIAGIIGVVIEAKDEVKYNLAGWCREAETERINDGADYGVVWAHRRGKASPGDGYVIMPGWQFALLLEEAGRLPAREEP